MKKSSLFIFFILIFSLNCFFLFGEEKIFTYEDLIFELNKNNLELQTLQEEYFRSTLDVKDAKAGRGPTVDLTLSGTYMSNALEEPVYLNVNEILDSVQWPAGTKPTLQNQYIQVYEGMENTLYNIEFSVLQPIFTWGKINNSIALYQKIAEISQLQFLYTT